MAGRPYISLIIVSYNCREFLEEAIRSVNSFITEPHEIIVVDNASSDDTRKVIPNLFPEVIFIANTGNNGFSKANNQGFAASSGEFILLLNPDAKLIDDSYKIALDDLQRNPGTILGPKILNGDLSLQDSVFSYPSFLNVFSETFFLTYFFKATLPEILKNENYALSGACLLMPRKIYSTLNGLDEELFWMDDVDFGFRAKQNGIIVSYEPGWKVVHIIGVSTKKNYNVAIANQLISKLKFFKKHSQFLNLSLSAILIEIHILLRILLFLILTIFKPVYRLKFLAYCHAQSEFFKYIFTNKKQAF